MSAPISNPACETLFKAWVGLCASLIGVGWLFSSLGWLEVGAWVGGVIILGFGAVIAWRMIAPGSRFAGEALVRFPPFFILFGLLVLVSILYPPTVLDSLSYRLPRLPLWLQEGGIVHFPTTNERINYMTPNWELVALPVFRWTGDVFLELPNLVSYVMLYLLMGVWAERFAPTEKQRWLAVIPVAGFLPVLQACRTSNDLFAMVFVLLSAWFLFRGHEEKTGSWLGWSLLALSLAAGTKPHYAVLLPFWGLGVLMGWRWVVRLKGWWRLAATWAVPVFVVSPAIVFWRNHLHYGTMKGPDTDLVTASGHAGASALAGAVMGLFQMFQLPVDPVSRTWNAWWQAWATERGITSILPKFSLYTTEIPIVDGATLGVAVACVLTVGWVLAFRNRRIIPVWVWAMALGGAGGYLLAASQVLPSTIGRSFIGMVYLAVAVPLAGLAFLPVKAIRVMAWGCVLAAVLTLGLTPSNPLWPVQTIAAQVGQSSPNGRLAAQLDRYATFSTRYTAGEELVAMIPPDAGLMAWMGGDEPLLQLFRPYSARRPVKLLPHDLAHATDTSNPAYRYLITGDIDPAVWNAKRANWEDQGWLIRDIASAEVTTKLQTGPRTWRLYALESSATSD